MTLTNGDSEPQSSSEVRFTLGDGDNSPPPSTPVGEIAEAEDKFPINEMNGFTNGNGINGEVHGSSSNLMNGMGIGDRRKRLK